MFEGKKTIDICIHDNCFLRHRTCDCGVDGMVSNPCLDYEAGSGEIIYNGNLIRIISFTLIRNLSARTFDGGSIEGVWWILSEPWQPHLNEGCVGSSASQISKTFRFHSFSNWIRKFRFWQKKTTNDINTPSNEPPFWSRCHGAQKWPGIKWYLKFPKQCRRCNGYIHSELFVFSSFSRYKNQICWSECFTRVRII